MRCSSSFPKPGDYIRLKCDCLRTYHEGIYLGMTEHDESIYGLTVRMAPPPTTGPFCYWSRKKFGDLSEDEREDEVREPDWMELI